EGNDRIPRPVRQSSGKRGIGPAGLLEGGRAFRVDHDDVESLPPQQIEDLARGVPAAVVENVHAVDKAAVVARGRLDDRAAIAYRGDRRELQFLSHGSPYYPPLDNDVLRLVAPSRHPIHIRRSRESGCPKLART